MLHRILLILSIADNALILSCIIHFQSIKCRHNDITANNGKWRANTPSLLMALLQLLLSIHPRLVVLNQDYFKAMKLFLDHVKTVKSDEVDTYHTFPKTTFHILLDQVISWHLDDFFDGGDLNMLFQILLQKFKLPFVVIESAGHKFLFRDGCNDPKHYCYLIMEECTKKPPYRIAYKKKDFIRIASAWDTGTKHESCSVEVKRRMEDDSLGFRYYDTDGVSCPGDCPSDAPSFAVYEAESFQLQNFSWIELTMPQSEKEI